LLATNITAAGLYHSTEVLMQEKSKEHYIKT